MPADARSAISRSRSASMSGAMWWVISPVSWLNPAPRSKVAEPSQTGRPARPVSSDLPEAHMVAAVGALADRLLEGKVLAAPLVEERADRRVAVGPVEDDAAGDLDAGLERHGVGGIPAGGGKRADRLLLGPDQPDIQRIAGNSVGGDGHHRPAAQPRLVLVMRPEARQHQIGGEQVDAEQGRHDCRGVADDAASPATPRGGSGRISGLPIGQ